MLLAENKMKDQEKTSEQFIGELKGIRERVRLLGGDVTIESTPNQRTRITVELPLLEMVPVETDPKPQ